MKIPSRTRVVSVSVSSLLLALSAVSARAQAGSVPDLGTAFSATAEQLRSASSAVPVSPEFEAQILLEQGTYRVNDDGTLTYTHRLVYRVDTSQGVNDWSEVSMQWDPWFEKPAQLEARVLQTDGRFATLEQKTVTDAPVKGDDSDTFSSEHVRRAPLPGLSPGAIVEEVTTLEEKTPYFADGNVYSFRFQSGVPIAHELLTVDLPSSLPYKDLLVGLPSTKVERSDAGGRRRTTYEQWSMPALRGSDVELATNEPNGAYISFATGASWKAIAAGYAKMADPQMVPEEAKTILPADLPTERMQRIGAIVTALHSNVRYTGVEFGSSKLTPYRPSEVIQRHYGDCKDKATLLVAMLRAAGIDAHVALLDTGPGRDVDPSLPGMSEFDHAIVYVPGAGRDKPVWIDATAEFFQPGILPWEDSGRNALVIAPETTALTRTPDPAAEYSTLIETREFRLAPFGPSRVIETSETHGILDAIYRSSYGGSDEKKTHDTLENYAKEAYYAKSLSKVTHGDPRDMAKPFQLTLEVDGARRGVTVMDEAVVAVFPTLVLDSLPRWFKQDAPVLGATASESQKHDLEVAQQSRAKSYTFRPFVDERRFRVIAPDGFTLRSLPANKTTHLGQATLTETYTSTEPAVVNAVLHFDSGPGRMTAQEAVAMRDDIEQFRKREYVGIYFDQSAAKEFAAGHVRQGLDLDRALITAHPEEALHHARLARLLLDAGIGDGAHAEAKRATELDPKSSTVFATYGWTLEHDSLGNRFGKGYDRAGAIAAYKKAIELDPDEIDPRFDLGILYEFDARGIRYTEQANLKDAIATYREILDRNKDKGDAALAQYRENMLYAMFFARQFDTLDAELAKQPATPGHRALSIASATVQHGTQAGLAQADKGNADAGDRNKNLLTAGQLLAQLRMYPEAATVLQAGIGGGEDAPATARQIEMYKTLKPVSSKPLAANDPAAPVQALTFGIMNGTLTREVAEKSLSHHAYASQAEFERDVEKNMIQVGFMSQVAKKSEMTEPVLVDLIAGNMTFSSTGDDATGYAILAKTPGSNDEHFFVVREDGAYRVVADDHDFAPVGNYALYALAHGNAKGAKAILDWRRDLMHKEGGDDPFGGPLLPRFWTVDSIKPGADSPEAMKLAAISLLAGTMEAKPFLPELVALREKASGQRQTDLDLLIADAAVGAEDADTAMTAAKHLLEQEPDSLTALRDAGAAYAYKHDAASWQAMLKPLLARRPKDHDLLGEQARAYESAGDFSAARAASQIVLDSGKADGSDYNSFAWLGLFDNHLGEAELKAAQQSNMLSKNSSFAELHTLACIYAAEGRVTEARQVLDQAMYAGNQTQPNSAVWYALGLIYEQYGANDAALAAYRKVEAHELDDHTYVDPMSTWLLAQARIRAITSSGSMKTAEAGKSSPKA